MLKILFGRPAQRPKLRPEDVRSVLLLRHDRLGDYVITTPLIEGLKRYLPSAEINVLASPTNADFVRCDPRINHVIVWEKTLFARIQAIRECRKRNVDLTLQLITHHTTAPAILASLCTPTGHVVGYGYSYNRGLFDHIVHRCNEHIAEQTFNIFVNALDFDGENIEMPPYSMYLPEEVEHSTVAMLNQRELEEKKYILLNLSASEPYRMLGKKKSVELAKKLRTLFDPLGITIVLTGAPGDKNMIESVGSASGATVLHFSSILAVSAGIRHAIALISPDTGPVHIASAVGTPVVAYYAEHGKPFKWKPLGVPNRVVLSKVDHSGSDIDVDEIIAATQSILRSEHLRT